MWTQLLDELRALGSEGLVRVLRDLTRVPHAAGASTDAEEAMLALVDANDALAYPLDLTRSDEARRVARAARGATAPGSPVQSLAALLEDPSAREEILLRFVELFPRAVWLETAAGRRWTAFGADDHRALAAGIAAAERGLAARVREVTRRPGDRRPPVESVAFDPTGRFMARTQLAPTVYTNTFRASAPQRKVALRDRTPLQVLQRGAPGASIIEPPNESWSFGVQLAFASHGDELFVLSWDPYEIRSFVPARDDGGETRWRPHSHIELPRGKRHALVHPLDEGEGVFELLDDDHVWCARRLYRRVRDEGEGTRWREVARCGWARALSRDQRTIVLRDPGEPLQIARGTPYVWEERATVRLPTGASPSDLSLDAEGRLHFEAGGHSWLLSRGELGWRQHAPALPGYRAEIEEPEPVLDFDAGARVALDYEVGADHPVGTWLRSPKLGVGVVIARDAQSRTLTLRFPDGSPRRFKVR